MSTSMRPFDNIQLGERVNDENPARETKKPKLSDNSSEGEIEGLSFADLKSIESGISTLSENLPGLSKELAGAKQIPEGCLITQELQGHIVENISNILTLLDDLSSLLESYNEIKSKFGEQKKSLKVMHKELKEFREEATIANISKNNAERIAAKAEKDRKANADSYMALLRQVEEQKLDIGKLTHKLSEYEIEAKHNNIVHLRETMELKGRIEQLELELKVAKEASHAAADREAKIQKKLKAAQEQKDMLHKQISAVNTQFLEYSQKAERRIRQMKKFCINTSMSFSFDRSSPLSLEMTSSRADLIPTGFSSFSPISSPSAISTSGTKERGFGSSVNSIGKMSMSDIHSIEDLEESGGVMGRIAKSIPARPTNVLSPTPPTSGQRFLRGSLKGDKGLTKSPLSASSPSLYTGSNESINSDTGRSLSPELMSARMRRLKAMQKGRRVGGF